MASHRGLMVEGRGEAPARGAAQARGPGVRVTAARCPGAAAGAARPPGPGRSAAAGGSVPGRHGARARPGSGAGQAPRAPVCCGRGSDKERFESIDVAKILSK